MCIAYWGDTDTAPHILNVSTGMCVPPRSLVHSYQLPSVAELPAVNAALLTPTRWLNMKHSKIHKINTKVARSLSVLPSSSPVSDDTE